MLVFSWRSNDYCSLFCVYHCHAVTTQWHLSTFPSPCFIRNINLLLTTSLFCKRNTETNSLNNNYGTNHSLSVVLEHQKWCRFFKAGTKAQRLQFCHFSSLCSTLKIKALFVVGMSHSPGGVPVSFWADNMLLFPSHSSDSFELQQKNFSEEVGHTFTVFTELCCIFTLPFLTRPLRFILRIIMNHQKLYVYLCFYCKLISNF